VTAALVRGREGQAQAVVHRLPWGYTLRRMNLTDGELFQQAARRSAAREPFVLCTVTATARSAPRDAGAKMIVAPDGSIAGTGGGRPARGGRHPGSGPAAQGGRSFRRAPLCADRRRRCRGADPAWSADPRRAGDEVRRGSERLLRCGPPAAPRAALRGGAR